MTTIPPERVEKARWWLKEFMPLGGGMLEEVIAILSGYSALKEEVKRLNTWHCTISEAWKARAEKTEAQLEKAKSDLIDESKRRAAIAKSLQAHQDQLAKQAPLIEAVMAWDGRADWNSLSHLVLAADRLRAALGIVVGD